MVVEFNHLLPTMPELGMGLPNDYRANWVRFGIFSHHWLPPFGFTGHNSPATRHSPLATRHSPLATRHSPLATRHSPLATRHSPLATRHSPLPPTTLPRWRLHDTDRRLSKTERGPISTSGPSISLCPNQAIPAHSSIRSFPLAAAHPLTVLSWPEALHVSGSRRACLMHIGRNACSLVALPDFSRSSPKQLGIVSPELQKRLMRHRRLNAPYATGGPGGRRVY